MRLAMRRTVGIGGAAAVALGAAMVLALPASAHNHSDSASCYNTTAQFQVNLANYTARNNTVTITDQGKTVVDDTFHGSYNKTIKDDDATVEHVFKITVVAGDDTPGPDGNGPAGFSFVDTQTSPVCETPPPPPPPASSSSTPPPPPASSSTPAPPTTTSEAVVAAATTTPAGPAGAAPLPNTGVNAGLPLGIAGGLVVIGGGILFWLRYSSRRKTA